MSATMTANLARASAMATMALLLGLHQDVALGQVGGAAQSPAHQNFEPQRGAAVTVGQTRTSVAESSPQVAAPDPLLGDWRMTYLADSSAAALKIEKVTRGIIGASLTGTFVAADGQRCPFSGAIFQTIAGMYPDGTRIVTMDITAMMRLAVQCDGRPIAIDAFLIDDRGRFSGAGRATADTMVSTIQLAH